jgi:hypothetical protein
MNATRLRITSLKFISAVDAGAQGPIANVALVKRAPTGDEYSLTATVAKLDEALGVVFGYAVASTVDGGQSPHVDLQGDAVVGGDELIKVALGFAEAGAQSDVMHDCIKDGWVPFVMPLNAETKKAFKLEGDVEGIAIGMKPSAETFKRFQSGELAAFSIFGTGERTPLNEQKRVSPTTDNAPTNKSTQHTTLPHGDDMKLIVLSEAQHAHYQKLAASEQEAYLAKSSIDRDVELEKARSADPVVFKGELTGIEVRKSHGDFAMKLAEGQERAEKRARDAEEQERIEKAAKETEVLKAAVKADIPHLAGADDVKLALYKAAKSIEGGLEILKGADSIMKAATVAKGAGGSPEPENVPAQKKLDALITKHATDNKLTRPAATTEVLKTPEGRALYHQANP